MRATDREERRGDLSYRGQSYPNPRYYGVCCLPQRSILVPRKLRECIHSTRREPLPSRALRSESHKAPPPPRFSPAYTPLKSWSTYTRTPSSPPPTSRYAPARTSTTSVFTSRPTPSTRTSSSSTSSYSERSKPSLGLGCQLTPTSATSCTSLGSREPTARPTNSAPLPP